jgi:hypothetical protein
VGLSWCWNNFSGGVDTVTGDSERAMVTTTGLYLVMEPILSLLWRRLPIGWMGANNEFRYGG